MSSNVFAEAETAVGVAGTEVFARVGTIVGEMSVGVGLGKTTFVAVGAGAGAAPMSDANTFREVVPHFCSGLI